MVGVKTEVGNRSSMALWAAVNTAVQLGEVNLKSLEEKLLVRGAAKAIADAIKRIYDEAQFLLSAVKKLVEQGPESIDGDELRELNDVMLDLAYDLSFLTGEKGVLETAGLWDAVQRVLQAVNWNGSKVVPVQYKVGDVLFSTLGRTMRIESPRWSLWFHVRDSRPEVMHRG